MIVAKIFKFREPLELPLIAQKLKDFKEEEPYDERKLTTDFLDLKLEDNSLAGVLSRDYVLSRYYKRGLVETPVTEECPFWIKRFDDMTFLVALAPSKPRGVKRLLTNHVANKLSEICFIKTGAIVEATIAHETLRELHESNPGVTRLIWFDQVDIPGVEKLALTGSALADTQLYRDYLDHGKIWYVVFQHRNLVVGITRNCVVTVFSQIERSEFIDLVVKEVFPLIGK